MYALERMDDQRQLTQRQREVLALYARGMKRPAIAAELGIKADTVRSHRQHILAKLGANSLQFAVVLGIARNELQLDGEVITASKPEVERVLQAA